MNKRTLTTILVIVLVIVLGAAIFAAVNNNGEGTTDDQTGTTTEEDVAGESTELITAQHQYQSEDGVHIVAGEITVPTPCHTLDTEVINEDDEVVIAFEVESQDEACAQVVETRRFKEMFQAPEDIEINATYNGEATTLNLMPVGPDVDLEEDFQVYIKG